MAETKLRFFNTMGRRMEDFEPLEPGRIGIYTCGPTVYNHPHIGNLRTFLFEEVLRRSLRYLGYEVRQVMNITDVDDKTIRGASEEGISLREFTERFSGSFFADLDVLRFERADVYPRATDHIPEMIDIIERLVERGYGYVAEDGSVFFRISTDADYGRLSGIDLDEVKRGDRVASDEYEKEDVRDFVLWKAAKTGEPSWESPWGPGRPGWHIECSAMSMRHLGSTFDIHCGGVDNIFPHHENEIAQSESATGRPFARYWLHAEHLIVEGEKMSKSLGNFYTLQDLLARPEVTARAVRYLFLSVHYRQKLNFTFEALEGAKGALRRVDDARLRFGHTPEEGEPRAWVEKATGALEREFRAALADDLNLSGALGALFVFIRAANSGLDADGLGSGDRDRLLASLGNVDRVLGVLDPADWKEEESDDDSVVEALVQEREEARRGRDFATADRVRDELKAMGILLEDTPHGTRWKREG